MNDHDVELRRQGREIAERVAKSAERRVDESLLAFGTLCAAEALSAGAGSDGPPQDSDAAAAPRDLLVRVMEREGDQICRDMAGHVGEQIFEVCRRNGMLMRSAGGATAMLVLAAETVLMQADEFLRTSLADSTDGDPPIVDDDCSYWIAHLFVADLPSRLSDSLRAELIRDASASEGRRG